MINLEEYPYEVVSEATATTACDIQDACNLTAVLHEWGRQAHEIIGYAHQHQKSDEWVRRHPIHLAFLSKVQSLMGAHAENVNALLDAHGWCQHAKDALQDAM